MACCRSGDKLLSESMMVSLLTHISVTRPQWVKSIRPSDTIWGHKSGWTLAQIMVCRLIAPSQYLHQCYSELLICVVHLPSFFSATSVILKHQLHFGFVFIDIFFLLGYFQLLIILFFCFIFAVDQNWAHNLCLISWYVFDCHCDCALRHVDRVPAMCRLNLSRQLVLFGG